MVFIRPFIIILALLVPLSVYSQVRCESIFGKKDLGEFGANAGLMNEHYSSMFRIVQEAAGTTSKSGEVTRDIYNASLQRFGTVVTKFKPKKTAAGRDSGYRDQIDENINFVLKSYSERRDWSPELREHLKKEAALYAEQSTYIEVRSLDNFYTYIPNSLIGTMKIVKVSPETPVKELPLEADFSVVLPANAGRKYEPANFVVDKNQNKLGVSEIFTQLILHAREQLKDPAHESGKMMYYTPGDRLGVKMYGKLGFVAVPGFEAPIKEGTKDWWMIGSTAENLANLPKKLAENRAQWADEDVAWMSQLVKNFENLSGSKTNREVSVGADAAVSVFLHEPYTMEGRDYRQLGILSADQKTEFFLRIPQEEFPLQDGWSLNTGGVRVLYKDGIFRVLDGPNKISILLKTDGAFKKPSYLRMWDKGKLLRSEF